MTALTESDCDALDWRRDEAKERALEKSHAKRQAIPPLPDAQMPAASPANDVDSSISLDLLIAISAGRIEALADLVHGREPNEDRAFARSTCREMWRPVFNLAFREQIGLSTRGEATP